MKFIESVIKAARAVGKRIVLPESGDARVLAAAETVAKRGIARVILLGDKSEISKKIDLSIGGLSVINPSVSADSPRYAELLYSLRKEKGMTFETAQKLVFDPLYYGALMLKACDADGMVAGAVNSTGDVLRPALQIVKAAPGIKTVSSCFIMDFEGTPFMTCDEERSVMIFADCAVNIDPDASTLADIAIASASSAKSLAGIKNPKVALLSFSTKGSAKHALADKVTDALKIIKTNAPEIEVDGELQADAALVPAVARLKAPSSGVAGCADVLVFPDLQSGNIGYKLVQRFSGADAIGPICQGFAKPVNDLSRGCSAEDIVAVVAITALQA